MNITEITFDYVFGGMCTLINGLCSRLAWPFALRIERCCLKGFNFR
jgi:hypothetical protein